MNQSKPSTRRASTDRKPRTSKTTTKPVRLITNRQLSPKVPQQLMHQVCGLTDPFCDHAIGAKYPDHSSVKSLPYCRRVRYTLSSDAGGFANLIINPQYGFSPYALVNVYAGNSVTSWTAFGAYPTIAGVTGYRIVSSGFVLRHIVSPLNSAGMVYVRQYGCENGLRIAPIDTTTYNATTVANVSVQEASEVAVILQKTSQMPQTIYPVESDLASVGNSTSHGYCYSTVSIAGAPASTPILEIEFIINFELVFEDSSDLAQVATPSPIANAMVTNAAAAVSSTLKPVLINGISSAGRMFVEKAGVALAGYLGGPPAAFAARTGLALTVD